jgi:hypothetical protein
VADVPGSVETPTVWAGASMAGVVAKRRVVRRAVKEGRGARRRGRVSYKQEPHMRGDGGEAMSEGEEEDAKQEMSRDVVSG